MTNSQPVDREALRREIQAAIAAGRELDPAMDTHLADSALDRYEQEHKTPARAPIVDRSGSSNGEIFARVITTIAGAGIFITILVLHPEYWWVIFFLGPMLGGWWGRGGRRWHHADDADYASRQQLRETRRRLKIQALESEIQRLKSGQEEV